MNLVNNGDDEETVQPMWCQFMPGRLEKKHIQEVFQKHAQLFTEDIITIYADIDAQTTSCNDLFQSMKTAFSDEVWKILTLVIRDKETTVIDHNKTVEILEGGQSRYFTVKDLEDKFMEDYPDLFTSQISVPSELIHNDFIEPEINIEKVIEQLKDHYDQRIAEVLEKLQTDYPKKKKEELEREAKKQALEETKHLKEATWACQRIALCAEDTVAKSIRRAAEKAGTPVIIFQGVKTLEEISQYLCDLGIVSSKLKCITKRKKDSTLECEHDVGVIALAHSGVVTSFVQVISLTSFVWLIIQLFSGQNSGI